MGIYVFKKGVLGEWVFGWGLGLGSSQGSRKEAKEKRYLAFMGIYVFKKGVLGEWVFGWGTLGASLGTQRRAG